MRRKILLMIILLFLSACSGGTSDPAGDANNGAESTENGGEAATSLPVPSPTVAPTSVPPTVTPAPTATSLPALPEVLTAEGVFSLYSEEPVVPHGPTGAWDGQFTDPGAVVFHEGRYHMFHNGFVGWPAPVGIAYSSSADGFTWVRESEEAVFAGDDLDYVGLTVLASSALVEADGTWVLYFYTWDENRWPARGAIGRATAPAPAGPWTADAAPVLLQGAEGEWDDYAVRAPSVVATEDGYVMYYAGYSVSAGRIGMATSPDGATWTKYDDPNTTDAPFAGSDPVFVGADEGWDSRHVSQPRVQQTPDGWVMLYSASPLISGSSSKLGYALSRDGLSWVRAEQPLFDHSIVPGGNGVWYTELLYQDGKYFIFFEVGIPGSGTSVYLATHAGSLLSGDG